MIIVLCIGLGWSIGALNTHYSDRAEHYSKQYAAHTKERIEKECVELEPARIGQCVQEIVEASRESERSEDDLSAQEAMAKWALWMLLATVAAVFISVLGLVALFRSLAQTRTVIRDTREIGEAQTRAYLTCSTGIMALTDGDNPKITCRPCIRNTGQTPAFDVHIEATICYPFGSDFPRKIRLLRTGNVSVVGADSEDSGTLIWLRHQVDDRDWDILWTCGENTISATLRWSDVFRKTHSATFTLFQNSDAALVDVGEGPDITGYSMWGHTERINLDDG